MKLLSSIPFIRTSSPKQVISESWVDRTSVHGSDVNLFVWKRPIEPATTAYLIALLERISGAIQFQAELARLDEQLEQARQQWDEHMLEQGLPFWKDVSQLVRDFLVLSNRDTGTVHLKVVDTNSCAKFHTDGYSLRLFTTYLGQGTEWLPEKATNRRGLGKTNALIVKDPSEIQQMNPFDVGILKGELPNHRSSVKGIVHKSPRIGGTGEKRIILRVDI